MTLLFRAVDGGYDEAIGFDATIKKPPVPVLTSETPLPENAYGDDWRSQKSIDWSRTTFDGDRRDQLRQAQCMTVRQRLETLDQLTELSERLQTMPRQPQFRKIAVTIFLTHDKHKSRISTKS